jgi:hypothetical protein
LAAENKKPPSPFQDTWRKLSWQSVARDRANSAAAHFFLRAATFLAGFLAGFFFADLGDLAAMFGSFV